MIKSARIACLLAAVMAIVPVSSGVAQDTSELKTLNGHFPFQVPETAEEWTRRAESLRLRVLVANGLWPMPERAKIEPVFDGLIEREGFTVQRVHFESLPGHFVTGLLLRPAEDNTFGIVDGKRPGVLSPHGHGGRLMKLDDNRLAQEIESGAEKYPSSGRYPKLARCAHLARMGCVTFIFDMLGYADSQQIEYQVAHRHADPRPEESDRDQPCFFSIDADLNLQSIMGLQTFNALRSMDFLASLDAVDEERLGVTGGSGGGTQSILLGAIDPRIRVSFPNGMVSTSMQGGCYCENCNYLRIGTGNVELAALFAPKPQGMTAADDWTRDMMTDGYPQLQQLYRMIGSEDDVLCRPLLHFPHNYNYVTRATMYPLMAKHLGLPENTPLVEADYKAFDEAELRVWNADYPAPKETGVAHERKVLRWWRNQSERSLKALLPRADATGSEMAREIHEYQRGVGGGWKVMFDRDMPQRDVLDIESRPSESVDGASVLTVKHPKWSVAVELIVVPPPSGASERVVVFTGTDSDESDQDVADAVAAATNRQTGDSDSTIVLMKLGIQAEENPQQPLIADKRTYSALTFGYNRPLVVKRFERILCGLAAVEPEKASSLHFAAFGDRVAPSAVAAAVVAGPRVNQFIVRTNGFRFSDVSKYSDESFLPGAAKYFDLPGLMSLRAPNPMTVQGDSADDLELVKLLYDAHGASGDLRIQ